MLPFLQTCSDKQLKNSITHSIAKKDREKCTLNAYQMASMPINNKFKIEDLKDSETYAFIIYIPIILISLLIIILSFKEKFHAISILSTSNICLIFISIGIFIFIKTIEDIHQIKYGLYLFLVNSGLIIYLCQKNKRAVIK
jgi:hypothetical protein